MRVLFFSHEKVTQCWEPRMAKQRYTVPYTLVWCIFASLKLCTKMTKPKVYYSG